MAYGNTAPKGRTPRPAALGIVRRWPDPARRRRNGQRPRTHVQDKEAAPVRRNKCGASGKYTAYHTARTQRPEPKCGIALPHRARRRMCRFPEASLSTPVYPERHRHVMEFSDAMAWHIVAIAIDFPAKRCSGHGPWAGAAQAWPVCQPRTDSKPLGTGLGLILIVLINWIL